jgi:IclR family pca regulon transcriptional regulator
MPRLRTSDGERRRERPAGPDHLEALERGLSVVSAFGADHRQMTLSDVARAVDLPKSTVRRALHTLAALGYLETDGRLYALAPQILRIANAYLSSNRLSRHAQAICERVADECDGSCSLSVMSEHDIVVVAWADPRHLQSVGIDVGHRAPAISTASGRALLAALDQKALDVFMAAAPVQKLTRATVTDRTKLRSMIDACRAEGFTVIDQETQPGFRSLAVPVAAADGTVVAALDISVRIERVELKAMPTEFLPLLQSAAAEIGAYFSRT